MNNIALFTGCFDPIHKQHLSIISALARLPDIDQVWIMINGFSEEKSLTLPFAIRREMVALNLRDASPKIRIYDRPITFYTTDLVRKLKKEDKNNDFYLVLGTDQANRLGEWERAEDLPHLVKFIFVPRGDQPLQKEKIDAKWSWSLLEKSIHDYKSSPINSSEIRSGRHWSWLTAETLAYIHRNHLYIPQILEQQMSADRYEHSHRVAALAAKIARYYRFSKLGSTFLAGLVHDATKEFTLVQHRAIWTAAQLPLAELEAKPRPTWHASTGALYLEQTFLLTDQAVLNAVRFHTTGRAEMTDLEKVIFVADKVDPEKKKSNMATIYQMLFSPKHSFEDIFRQTLQAFCDELIARKLTPTSDTIAAANGYLKANYFGSSRRN